MPGISVYCSRRQFDDKRRQELEAAVTLTQAGRRDSNVFSRCGDHSYVSLVAYPEYPRLIHESDSCVLIVEGAVYNRKESAVRDQLVEICGRMCQDECASKDDLTEWISGSDGEYVILYLDKADEQLLIANDALGQLPLFWNPHTEQVTVSRDQRFLERLLSLKIPDKVGIAEYLSLGFAFTRRTMMTGIERLAPFSFIHFSSFRGTRLDVLQEWNLESLGERHIDLKAAAADLATTFVESTRNRVSELRPRRPMLALSGGLDSRAVLAALDKCELSYSAYTHLRNVSVGQAELDAAAELADVFNCEWRAYHDKPVMPDDAKTIVENQCGGSSTAMSVALRDHSRLEDEFGTSLSFLTGDGGNQDMYSSLPTRQLRNSDEVFGAIFGMIYDFESDTISRLLRIERDEFIEPARAFIEDMPERNHNWKYAHYRVIVRGLCAVTSGEDRTRKRFWLLAPFWGLDMFKQSMSVPYRLKVGYKFYTEFLRQLDPRALDVVYADLGGKPGSLRTDLYNRLKRFVTANRKLYRIAKRVTHRQQASEFRFPELDRYIDGLIDRSSYLPECFDMRCLKELRESHLTLTKYHALNTLVLRMALSENAARLPEL